MNEFDFFTTHPTEDHTNVLHPSDGFREPDKIPKHWRYAYLRGFLDNVPSRNGLGVSPQVSDLPCQSCIHALTSDYGSANCIHLRCSVAFQRHYAPHLTRSPEQSSSARARKSNTNSFSIGSCLFVDDVCDCYRSGRSFSCAFQSTYPQGDSQSCAQYSLTDVSNRCSFTSSTIQVPRSLSEPHMINVPLNTDDSSLINGDITAAQAASGVDVQGIPWENLPFSREDYRATRLRDSSQRYGNSDSDGPSAVKEPGGNARYYSFSQNTRRVKCSIVHFQLRNLAWATSKHDVIVMHEAGIIHWDAAARRKSTILDLSGSNLAVGDALPNVQISTIIGKGDLAIAGGFYGEVVMKNLRQDKVVHNKRITYDDNAITNAFDIFGTTLMTSSNDCYVRCFDLNTFRKLSAFKLRTPVNHATRQLNGKLVCAVGDDKLVQVFDGDTGKSVHQLVGHDDFSFATWWHPDGRLFASGSQDKTSRVWDVRNMSHSLYVLAAHTSPVRAIRFSNCGKFLAMAEQKDFVHLFDVRSNFNNCQEIDLFGEIGGITFSPCDESLFVAVSDRAYSSLIEFNRDGSMLIDQELAY